MTAVIANMPAHRPCSARGWLVFADVLPPDLGRAEAATQDADFAYRRRTQRPFTRLATPTEKLLLAHTGISVPPDNPDDPLLTLVSFPSPAVRRRRWPQLTFPHPAP